MQWDSTHTPKGDWYWWLTLPNGWTAWVRDWSQVGVKIPAETRYDTLVTAPGRVVNGKSYESFNEAKDEAAFLGMAQLEYINKNFRISARLPKPKENL